MDNQDPDSNNSGKLYDASGNVVRYEDIKEIKSDQTKILGRIKRGERWMIGFTAIIALTTVAQYFESCQNNKSTSRQIDKVIQAANTQASAAINNAQAAVSFASSANGINLHSRQAVAEFNRLATASLNSAQTSQQQFDLAKKQMERTKKQIVARLVIKNLKTDTPLPPNQDNATISFDVFNLGSTAATEIAEDGGPGTFDPSKQTREESFGEAAKERNISSYGFSLDKGEHQHFEIPANGWVTALNHGKFWWTWKRFTYLDVYGEIDSICVIVMGTKHGLGPVDCPQTKKVP